MRKTLCKRFAIHGPTILIYKVINNIKSVKTHDLNLLNDYLDEYKYDLEIDKSKSGILDIRYELGTSSMSLYWKYNDEKIYDIGCMYQIIDDCICAIPRDLSILYTLCPNEKLTNITKYTLICGCIIKDIAQYIIEILSDYIRTDTTKYIIV